MDQRKAKNILEKQYKRQNNYIKNNYDKVGILLPRGTKERIAATGQSLNGFIKSAVLAELERIEQRPASDVATDQK